MSVKALSTLRCLLVPDKAGWSIDRIARALVRHNSDPSLTLDVLPLKGHVDEFLSMEKGYDRVFLLAHQQYEMLPFWSRRVDKTRWLTGIHSHHAFDKALLTTPEHDVPPPKSLLRLLRKFRAVNAVSPRLAALFACQGIGVVCTLNGVDTEEFKPLVPISTDGRLRVGFAGTAKGIHDRRKGYSDLVVPACRRMDVCLIEAIARTDSVLPMAAMADFYNQCDAFLLPSSSEGCSLAMLEALACGRVVIATKVGGAVDAIQHGFNGFLVDRTVDAIAEALEKLKDREMCRQMGWNARTDVVRNWSWKVRAGAWLEFLKV